MNIILNVLNFTVKLISEVTYKNFQGNQILRYWVISLTYTFYWFLDASLIRYPT